MTPVNPAVNGQFHTLSPKLESQVAPIPQRQPSKREKAASTRPGTARERGAALVEVAFVFPITLIVLTALLQFAVYINNSLELENATSLAGQYLALNRGAANPCALTVSAFEGVESGLIPASLNFSFTLNGASFPNTTTCTAGSAQLTQGSNATVNVTYPCAIAIFNVNLTPTCTLAAQVTEVIQ